MDPLGMYGALIVDAVLFGCLSKKKIPTKIGSWNHLEKNIEFLDYIHIITLRPYYITFLGCGVTMSHPSHKKRRKLQPELLTVSGYVFLWYTVFIHFPPKSTQFCRQTMAIILVSGYGRSFWRCYLKLSLAPNTQVFVVCGIFMHHFWLLDFSPIYPLSKKSGVRSIPKNPTLAQLIAGFEGVLDLLYILTHRIHVWYIYLHLL